MNKHWYQSKTLWFNVFSALAVGIQFAIDNQMAVQWLALQVLAIAMINAILRLFFTDTNLTK